MPFFDCVANAHLKCMQHRPPGKNFKPSNACLEYVYLVRSPTTYHSTKLDPGRPPSFFTARTKIERIRQGVPLYGQLHVLGLRPGGAPERGTWKTHPAGRKRCEWNSPNTVPGFRAAQTAKLGVLARPSLRPLVLADASGSGLLPCTASP